MDYATQVKLHQVVVDGLAELGIPNARISCVNTRVLVRDGYYIGRSFQCEHIHVVLPGGGEVVEFYGGGGALLKRINVTGASADQRSAA